MSGERVLNPGAGEAWWWTADGPAWRDGDGHWLLHGDTRESWTPPAAVYASDRAERDGTVIEAIDGWLLRHRAGSTRSLGEAERLFAIGPKGAVVVADREAFVTGGGPRNSVKALPVELSGHTWGLRWSPDGTRVAGIGIAGDGVVIDLTGPTVLRRRVGHWPVDTEGVWFDCERGELQRGDQVLLRGLLWASWARKGPLLGGVGGVSWDLEAGARLFEEPVFRFGGTVAMDGAWANVDWQTGEGRWIDPRTGQVTQTFALPLVDDDAVMECIADGDAAIFTTVERWAWRVRGSTVDPVDYRALPESDEGGSAVVGGRRWRWNDQGMLVSYDASA